MAQEVGAKAQVGSVTGKDGGKGLCMTKWKADKKETYLTSPGGVEGRALNGKPWELSISRRKCTEIQLWQR